MDWEVWLSIVVILVVWNHVDEDCIMQMNYYIQANIDEVYILTFFYLLSARFRVCSYY